MTKQPVKGRRTLTSLRAHTTSAWLLVLSGLPLACHKDGAQRAQPAKGAPKDPTALARTAQAARQSLAGLEFPLKEANAKIAALHGEFDPLPPDLPDFGETRSKFYATSIGLGTLNAKLPWLAGRIDAAVAAGDSSELDKVNKDVTHTYAELRMVERIALELFHEVIPFQKAAQNFHGFGKCE